VIAMSVTLGQDAFKQGHFVYVWLNEKGRPFYVGETGKSPIDRVGLHIRDVSRSGAIVSKIIQERNNPTQQYLILAFPIELSLLEAVAKENGATNNEASFNRARKALERAVYDELIKKYSDMHKARGCRWSANKGDKFAKTVLEHCGNSGHIRGHNNTLQRRS
jgi:hypothetical protein